MKKVFVTSVMVFFVLAVGLAAHAAAIENHETAGVININTANEDQLRMLPLINNQIAKAIISYRNSNGPFDSVEDLGNVKGVTPQKLEALRPWLVTRGDSTFVPDLYNTGPAGPVY
jgi:competence ComEA-like helix-hairpin-helix protein